MLTGESRKPAQAGLILVMVVCAFGLWLGSPAAWLWIGSHVTSSQQPGFGPYMLVGGGIVVSTIVLSMALARLNRAYERVTGERRTVRLRLPWMRSLRDERTGPTELTVLDVILVSSALAAIFTLGVWFLFLSGSSLPS